MIKVLTKEKKDVIIKIQKEREEQKMNKMLEMYLDKTIRIKGFEAKETVEMAELCVDCEKGIIPFTFIQKYFKVFVENGIECFE